MIGRASMPQQKVGEKTQHNAELCAEFSSTFSTKAASAPTQVIGHNSFNGEP